MRSKTFILLVTYHCSSWRDSINELETISLLLVVIWNCPTRRASINELENTCVWLGYILGYIIADLGDGRGLPPIVHYPVRGTCASDSVPH